MSLLLGAAHLGEHRSAPADLVMAAADRSGGSEAHPDQAVIDEADYLSMLSEGDFAPEPPDPFDGLRSAAATRAAALSTRVAPAVLAA